MVLGEHSLVGTPYDVLSVEEDASDDGIKVSYWR